MEGLNTFTESAEPIILRDMPGPDIDFFYTGVEFEAPRAQVPEPQTQVQLGAEGGSCGIDIDIENALLNSTLLHSTDFSGSARFDEQPVLRDRDVSTMGYDVGKENLPPLHKDGGPQMMQTGTLCSGMLVSNVEMNTSLDPVALPPDVPSSGALDADEHPNTLTSRELTKPQTHTMSQSWQIQFPDALVQSESQAGEEPTKCNLRSNPRSGAAGAVSAAVKGTRRLRGSGDGVIKLRSIGRNSTSSISVDEKKRIRAEGNRLSAEKSRIRGKQMSENLERGLALLREESHHLKLKAISYKGQLETASIDVVRIAGNSQDNESRAARERVPVLLEALTSFQSIMSECPHTFATHQAPAIPLNFGRKKNKGAKKTGFDSQ